MSSNSKEFPYELFRKMHQDLQKQMLKITECPSEPPATAIPKPPPPVQRQQPQQVGSGGNLRTVQSIPSPVRPQPFEKKTFEQAYRDAVERLNAAAMNKPGSNQRPNSYGKSPNSAPHQASPARSVTSSNSSSSVPSGMSNSASSSMAASPQSQYKTTIYNINTINLAELLKSQRSAAESISGRSGTNLSPGPTSSGTAQNAFLSQNSVARVIAESNKYRQTFSNAYANHLLELTKNAVEKKTGKPAPQRASPGGFQYIPPGGQTQPPSSTMQPKTFNYPTVSPSTTANMQAKRPKKNSPSGSYVLNGKDSTAPTYAEVVSSSSGGKTNGNVLLKIDRKVAAHTSQQTPVLNSLDAMMAAHSNRSKTNTVSVLETKLNEPRLKPSNIPVNHEEIYRRMHNQIIEHAQKHANSTNLSVKSRFTDVPSKVTTVKSVGVPSTTSLPVPDIGNRPDLTIIANKPRISSPAPTHVYGKPSISVPIAASSTSHDMVSSAEMAYKAGLMTPKRELATFTEPPPAHGSKSPFVPELKTSPSHPSLPALLPVKEPILIDTHSITPKSRDLTAPSSDGVLNLDTKGTSPLPSSTLNKSKSPIPVYSEPGLQSPPSYRSSGDRSSSLYSSQKVVKIEKRVNYDNKTNNLDTTPSRYQQNVVWKEQPAIKSESPQNGNGDINEQKKKLLELLHNANLQQLFTQAQAHAQLQARSPQNASKAAAGTNSASTTALSMQMNKINMKLYNYRYKNLNSTSSNIVKPIDPLAIKPDPDRQIKRKDPPKRHDAAKRKRVKLARSTDPYLQNGPCHEVASRLPRCRECGRSAAARSKDAANIFCRFIAFRKLKYNELGQLEVVGFADPNLDPQSDDTGLWNANLSKVPIDLSVEKSKFLLGQVGYKFCELFHQEKEAFFEHMSADKTTAWKQAVQGVREMCDVCSTTLFNYHWVCSTCGFVVCIDCYKHRKYGASKNDTGTRDRDGYLWLHCTTREPHVQEKLMLTQIIPSNSLYKLVRQMHGICALLEIPLNCECPLSKESLFRKIKDRLEFIYPITIEIGKDGAEAKNSSDDKSLIPAGDAAATTTTTKMISITIKNIESMMSETVDGTICCKVIFGRELSGDKNPEVELLKRREKQSYSFDGFQKDIKIERLDDFIKEEEEEDEDDDEEVESVKSSLENKVEVRSGNSDKAVNGSKDMQDVSESAKTSEKKIENKENTDGTVPDIVKNETDTKNCSEKDPLETCEDSIQESKHKVDSNTKSVEKVTKESDKQEEEPYSEEHRLRPSPKLDWKTFNMIVKQLLKFDKSINISGLFEKHLTEKCQESESLVDFTAEIQVNNSNIQSFLHDFLNEFVFLTGQNSSDNLTDDVQILEYNKYMKKSVEFQNKGERIMSSEESEKLYPNVAHQWLCNGRLLRLLDPLSDNNYTSFHDQWERGQPVMVSYVSSMMNMNLWNPKAFGKDFGADENDLINCLNGKLVRGQQMKVFWDGFDRIGYRLLDERDRPMLLKLKDWPPGDDFAEMMPSRFNDLMKCLPLAEYTRREGRLNLASRLSRFFVRPDLGPKMYSAYGSALHPTKGTTNLHLDVSDAVNVMVYVGVPKDVEQNKYIQKVLEAIDTDDCDIFTRQRIRDKDELPGAVWHIYHAKDADNIRSLLHKIEVERGGSVKTDHDPIHDQKWYLDANLRRRLLQEYNVEGYSIVQCSGDAIFIPAGAPHQVRNLHNCIKVAEDFVSPENISYCFKLTNEFRHLTSTHSNHEDKLQIKNIIYHTVKDAVSCLTNPLIMTKDKIDVV